MPWRCDLAGASDYDAWFEEQFSIAVTELDWDSTPGCCVLKNYGTSNREIFGWDGLQCDDERYAIVRGTVRARFDSLMRGDMIADPLNMFVKQEPCKVSKDELGAYRLISGVSLIDCMVDRILFGWLVRSALSSVLETPVMVGWSPIRGGWRYITRLFCGRPVVCLDKSAWDWTVLEWMVKAFETFILELPVDAPDWWTKMVKVRITLLYRDAVFKFKDGTEMRQGEWGIQKSGSLLTIIFNSVLQVLLHEMARPGCRKKMVVMGDDTAQEEPDDLVSYVSAIQGLGPKIKEVRRQHWVEFAGFAFFGRTCIPAYWKKHLFTLRYTETPEQTLQSYQILYAHEPSMYAYVSSELKAYGSRVVYPLAWCRAVMNE
uniref:RNA-directed RNA polymerase C-terminal domain-containing protein n=1 Tax=Crocidura tanakae ribovirus 2 TaxID=3139557 RepID=A0AB38ZKA2_9VIRU